MSYYGWDPACEDGPDVLAEREAIAGELTGSEICEAAAWNLPEELDALYLLACDVADATDQQKRARQFDLLQKFVKHAVAAREAAIDIKLRS